MLKSLGVLPEELKVIVKEFASMPKCVKVIDMADFDESEGMSGGIYVVMSKGTPLWERDYQAAEKRSMKYLAGRWEESWDTTDGIVCTDEESPLYFLDISNYIEGENYRVLSIADAIKEVNSAVS